MFLKKYYKPYYIRTYYDFKTSEQELQDAAEGGDIGEVARLMKSGVSVNSTNHVSGGCKCILYSAYCYQYAINIFIENQFSTPGISEAEYIGVKRYNSFQ